MVKGISPLVATVLLIAITMTLAGILAFWGSSFVKTGLPTEEETQKMRECNLALDALRIEFQFYNETSKTLSLGIYNTAPTKLNLTNATFFYSTSWDSKEINKEISPASTIYLVLENVNSGYMKYRIYTNCPGVYLEGK
ncbi:MAG: archaellin/type IV pilin N-terminal domain-containing protein [Candidatus Aenigmatarchaeota archaeon]